MVPGCLLVCNDVDVARDAEFNRWYQEEHLAERMSVPGFITARRYIAVDETLRYVALYETRGPEVLVSPIYATMLGAPTPRTKAIMPAFLNMTRAIGRLAFKRDTGVGGVMGLIFITAPGATDEQARHIGELAFRAQGRMQPPEAVRVFISEQDPVGKRTPESALRPGPDRAADVALIVEWMRADATDVAALHAVLRAEGLNIEKDRGGLYRLLCARRNLEVL